MIVLDRPPLARLRKRIPRNAQAVVTHIEAVGRRQLVGVTSRECQYALGFIVSVWARNSALTGTLPLTNRDYMFIQRCGVAWAERLPPAVEKKARAVIDDLKEKGFIPG